MGSRFVKDCAILLPKVLKLSESGCRDSDGPDGNRPVAKCDTGAQMRHTLFAAFLCLALADSTAALQQQPTAVPVGVVRAAHKLIARTTDFVGRVEAISRVEIRARITGFLDEVQFKEGDLIKAGAPLYRIEKGLLQAQIEQAEGALERSKAAKMA